MKQTLKMAREIADSFVVEYPNFFIEIWKTESGEYIVRLSPNAPKQLIEVIQQPKENRK